MRARLRGHLTYANVVSTFSLFILLGGSAVAAKQFINGRSIKPGSIPGNRLKAQTVTGKQVAAGTLGTVPNSMDLAGRPGSSYRLHCPSNLQQAGDVCFEPSTRTGTDWPHAMQSCQNDQLRVPTQSELALVFSNIGAPAPFEWTSAVFLNGSTFDAIALSQSGSRDLLTSGPAFTSSMPYRCVTGAGN